MRLAHLHIPYPIAYAHSLKLQEALVEKQIAYNAHILKSTRPGSSTLTRSPPQPPPTLLTFQTHPVYTVGRRHLKSNPLSQSQINFLTTNTTSPAATVSENSTELATFYPSPRGGLLTYHAPGQLTAYLIVNLRLHTITPRCFIRLLENTVIQTCARHGIHNALTTGDPGVWIGERDPTVGQFRESSETSCGGDQSLRPTTRKICAIGVHITRGITSHGIGLNVRDAAIVPPSSSQLYTLSLRDDRDPLPAPGYLSWGFGRIVACGLEGKSVTWMTAEGAEKQTTPDAVATTLAEELCENLSRQGKISVTGVEQINEQEVLAV